MITDGGLVYVSDGAWLACLWALADYRGMAERLGSPRLLPTARRFIAAAAAVRQYAVGRGRSRSDYGDVCDDQLPLTPPPMSPAPPRRPTARHRPAARPGRPRRGAARPSPRVA